MKKGFRVSMVLLLCAALAAAAFVACGSNDAEDFTTCTDLCQVAVNDCGFWGPLADCITGCQASTGGENLDLDDPLTVCVVNAVLDCDEQAAQDCID